MDERRNGRYFLKTQRVLYKWKHNSWSENTLERMYRLVTTNENISDFKDLSIETLSNEAEIKTTEKKWREYQWSVE